MASPGASRATPALPDLKGALVAITTGDGYVGSAKQIIPFTKTAPTTTIAATRFSVFDKAGNPGAGTLALTTATTGVCPTDATAGYPSINAFSGGAKGYLSRVAFASSVVGRIGSGTACSASTSPCSHWRRRRWPRRLPPPRASPTAPTTGACGSSWRSPPPSPPRPRPSR